MELSYISLVKHDNNATAVILYTCTLLYMCPLLTKDDLLFEQMITKLERKLVTDTA